jgi:outer membrane protein assembly factor BamB
MTRRLTIVAALVLTMVAAAARPYFGSAQASTAWPTFHADLARDGAIAVSGTNATTVLDRFQLGPRATSEIPSSPVVDKNGVAYIGDDTGNVYALDPVYAKAHTPLTANGEATKWVFHTQGASQSPPLAVASTPSLSPDGSRLFFGSDDGNVYAVNTADGTKVWSTQLNSPVRASPLVSSDGNTLYVPTANGALFALSAADGSKKLSNSACGGTGGMFCPGYAMPTSAAASPDGGTIYVVSGTYMYAVPASGVTGSNGAKIFYLDSNGTSTPVVDSAGNIYVGTQLGELEIFSPSNSAPIKTFQVPKGGAIVSSPAILPQAGLAVFGASDGLYAINIGSGLRAWSASLAGFNFIDSSPALASGNYMLYVGSSDGNLYEINAAGGSIVNSPNFKGRIDSSPAIGPDGTVWVSILGGEVDHVGALVLPSVPPTPANSPTPIATSTPAPTNTPVATNTPTATATPAQVPLSISVQKSSVKDGQTQIVNVTSAPSTDVHIRVVYPNGDHQSHKVTTDASGKATYSYTQGSSKMTHNKFTTTIRATAGTGAAANTATATYKLVFGQIDVSAEPRKLAAGKTVDVFVHAATGSRVQVYLIPPSGKLVSRSGHTGPKGLASIKYRIPSNFVSGHNKKVSVLAKFNGKPSPTTKSFITIT